MTTISTTDLHYFKFHIVATFAEYLNDVEKCCYQKLTDDWWENCAKEFVPTLNDTTANLNETQKKLYTKVMSEFRENLLTETQTKELTEQVEMACQAFIDRYKPVCYCGDRTCDFDCGVQSCGMCIDCCRCYKYW
jgi:hypothetical protein